MGKLSRIRGLLPVFFLVSLSVQVSSSRRSFDGKSNQREAINCSSPQPQLNTILKWRKDRSNSVFLPGETAEFVCKEGFRQIGWLKTLICQADGTWKDSSAILENYSSKNVGHCITNHCNGSKSFNCTDGSKSVDICHLCDCVADCDDGSDELSCDSILINVTGHATGILKYPNPSPEKSAAQYTGPLNCSRTLWTDDPGFYIKLSFKKFILPPNCSDNYVFLENVTFTDPNRSPKCCNQIDRVSCVFGKESSPPLSRTIQNWMIVTIVSSKPNSSNVGAVWYNVNGFFPNGVIPKDDPTYSDEFKYNKSTSSPPTMSEQSEAYIAAVVMLSLVLFALFLVLSCQIGQKICGTRCSVAHCLAWIEAKRSHRSRPPSSIQETRGSVTRPLSDNTANQGGPQRSQNCVAADPSSPRTRYGSDGVPQTIA